MHVKQLEGSAAMHKLKKIHVALKGEVCVRTDLVRSVTTDPTKQAVRSGQTCCSDPVVFNQMIKKTVVLLPLPVTPSFSCLLSFSLISKPPSIIDLIPRFLSL